MNLLHDSLIEVTKDKNFIAVIRSRVSKSNGDRTWISYRELKHLRTLAARSSSSDKKKNRRLRNENLLGCCAAAEEHIEARAGMLLAEKLNPSPRPSLKEDFAWISK